MSASSTRSTGFTTTTLASAASLRDHTRRLWQKYQPSDAALAQEYERRAAEAFASPACAFIQQLRNFTLHRRLPLAPGRLTLTPESFDAAVVLHADDLREWDGWRGNARGFLAAAADELVLANVVGAYTRSVATFNDWFGPALVGEHLTAFDELGELERELADKYRAWIGDPGLAPPAG